MLVKIGTLKAILPNHFQALLEDLVIRYGQKVEQKETMETMETMVIIRFLIFRFPIRSLILIRSLSLIPIRSLILTEQASIMRGAICI